MKVYKCDLCKKEIPENGLNKISVPLNKYMLAKNNGVTLAKWRSGVEIYSLDIYSSCGAEIAKFFELLGVSK